jgi:hypothetical protein
MLGRVFRAKNRLRCRFWRSRRWSFLGSSCWRCFFFYRLFHFRSRRLFCNGRSSLFFWRSRLWNFFFYGRGFRGRFFDFGLAGGGWRLFYFFERFCKLSVLYGMILRFLANF